MIFTECPYCSEPQAFCWEAGDRSGYFPSRCSNCLKVMWVEASTIGTTRTTNDFKEEIMLSGDDDRVDAAVKRATNQSSIVPRETA